VKKAGGISAIYSENYVKPMVTSYVEAGGRVK
jgi:hypothetical protein